MSVSQAAGTTIGITASAPSTYNAAGYGALTFTTIGEITNIGEFGRVWDDILHKPLANLSTQHLKGGWDEGNVPLQLGLDETDAGQTLAMAAEASTADYYFCVTRVSGKKHYFPAKVMSFKKNTGDRAAIVTGTINLAINASSGGVGMITV